MNSKDIIIERQTRASAAHGTCIALLVIAITISSCVYTQRYRLIQSGSTTDVSSDSFSLDTDHWYHTELMDVTIKLQLSNKSFATTYLYLDLLNHGDSPLTLDPSRILVWDEANPHKDIYFDVDNAPFSLSETFDLTPGSHTEILIETTLRIPKDMDWADTIYVWLGDFILAEGDDQRRLDTLRFVPTRRN